MRQKKKMSVTSNFGQEKERGELISGESLTKDNEEVRERERKRKVKKKKTRRRRKERREKYLP